MVKRLMQAFGNRINHLYYSFVFGDFGKGSWVKKPIRIVGGKSIIIGNGCSILHGARIECVNEFAENKFNPEIRIGNHVNIEQNLHMTCAGKIVIGNKVSILANVLITDIHHMYEDVEISPKYQKLEIKPVVISDDTFIGMGARILPGVTIGKHAVIGTNAVVTHDVPDYTVVAGIPARPVKVYNKDSKVWEKVAKTYE